MEPIQEEPSQEITKNDQPEKTADYEFTLTVGVPGSTKSIPLRIPVGLPENKQAEKNSEQDPLCPHCGEPKSKHRTSLEIDQYQSVHYGDEEEDEEENEEEDEEEMVFSASEVESYTEEEKKHGMKTVESKQSRSLTESKSNFSQNQAGGEVSLTSTGTSDPAVSYPNQEDQKENRALSSTITLSEVTKRELTVSKTRYLQNQERAEVGFEGPRNSDPSEQEDQNGNGELSSGDTVTEFTQRGLMMTSEISTLEAKIQIEEPKNDKQVRENIHLELQKLSLTISNEQEIGQAATSSSVQLV